MSIDFLFKENTEFDGVLVDLLALFIHIQRNFWVISIFNSIAYRTI